MSSAWPDAPATNPCMDRNLSAYDDCHCLRPRGHEGMHSCGIEGCAWG